MRAQALENLKNYRVAGMFNPPLLGKTTGGLRGAINVGNASGGTNWPGAGAIRKRTRCYAQAAMAFVSGLSLRAAPPSSLRHEIRLRCRRQRIPRSARSRIRERRRFTAGGGAGRAGAAAPGGAAARGGRGAAAPPRARRGPASRRRWPQVDGLPIVKPPYGVLSAIDLDKGESEVPGAARRHARQRPHPSRASGLNIPKTGQNGSVGLVVTKTLVVLGDPQVTAPPGRARGAMLRAYDKNNGTEVGAVWMPAAQSGSPMTYMADGKQYFVVAVSGGIYSGEYHRVRAAERTAKQQHRAAVSTSTPAKRAYGNDTNVQTQRPGGERHRRGGRTDDGRAAHDGPALGTGAGISDHQERRVAVLHRPTSEARAILRSTKSTGATSTSSRSPGDSRPTTSAPVPNSSSKARR